MERSAQRRLNEEAAGWLLTLQDEPTQASEAGFREWLKQSADHMQTFLEVTAIDRDLGRMESASNMDLDALIAQVRAEGGAQVLQLQGAAPAARTTVRARGSLRLKMAIAAGIAAAGIALWMALAAPTEYATVRGEQRSIKLPDGSVIHFNTSTRIKVRFNAGKREVRLLTGEAFFSVEQDPARPFEVIAGPATVRILGTEFNVYRRPDTTTVSVLAGRVGLSGEVLGAGQEAGVDRDGRVTRHPGADVRKAIAWRERQLDFDRAPLAFVVEQFNRYNDLQLRIVDPALGSRELEGVFNADEPEALLDFLEQEPDLHIERRRNEVLIRRR